MVLVRKLYEDVASIHWLKLLPSRVDITAYDFQKNSVPLSSCTFRFPRKISSHLKPFTNFFLVTFYELLFNKLNVCVVIYSLCKSSKLEKQR